MTLLFRCKRCGAQAASLEGHRCVAAPVEEADRADRLQRARAVLSEAEARTEIRKGGPSPTVTSSPEPEAPKGPGFDRNAYHKAYMREYMRRRRAKGGTIPG